VADRYKYNYGLCVEYRRQLVSQHGV